MRLTLRIYRYQTYGMEQVDGKVLVIRLIKLINLVFISHVINLSDVVSSQIHVHGAHNADRYKIVYRYQSM
jgi:hypothetical protein